MSSVFVMCGRSRIGVHCFFDWVTFLGGAARHAPWIKPSIVTDIETCRFRLFARQTAARSFNFRNDTRSSRDEPQNRLHPVLDMLELHRAIKIALMNDCTNPRDKVYGVYGLLSDCGASLPPVNYSVSEFELYQAFTRAMITITGAFWPAAIYVPDNVHPDLPSWVPNLSITAQSLEWWESDKGHLDLPAQLLEFKVENNIVETAPVSVAGAFALRGTSVSHVSLTAGQQWPTKKEDFPESLFAWMQFVARLEDEAQSSPEGWACEPVNAFVGLLFVGLDEKEIKQAKKLLPFVGDWFIGRRTLEVQGPDSNGFISKAHKFFVDKSEKGGDTNRFTDVIGKTFIRTSLFLTAQGDLGFARGQVKQGDTVVLLTGCPDPVVLRKKGEYWRLVGKGFVHGVESDAEWRKNVPVSEMETFVIV